jgi:hypothetical protein
VGTCYITTRLLSHTHSTQTQILFTYTQLLTFVFYIHVYSHVNYFANPTRGWDGAVVAVTHNKTFADALEPTYVARVEGRGLTSVHLMFLMLELRLN